MSQYWKGMDLAMSPRSPNLPVPEAERFYDRMGGWLDCHAFYEDAALDWLLAHGQFGCGGIILELGCGTGRFAERLLTREMRPDARYVGLDLSWRLGVWDVSALAPTCERSPASRSSRSPTARRSGSCPRMSSTSCPRLTPGRSSRRPRA